MPDHALARLLSVRALVQLGLLSYGWYVWHWPLLSFSRSYWFFDRSLAADLALGGGLGLALAAASYWGLERPLRSYRGWVQQRAWLVIIVTLVLCAIGSLASHGYARYVSASLERGLRPGQWPVLYPPSTRPDACVIAKGKLSSACEPEKGPSPMGLLF